ncbi:MAG: anti-sigma factor family protein [Gemmatimonadota bacterium]
MSEHSQGAIPHRLPHDWQRESERHEVIASLLATYIDGELPPEAAGQVEAHLVACRRCTKEVALQRQLAASLGQLGGPVASAALHTRIRSALAAAPVPVPVVAPRQPTGVTGLGVRWRWIGLAAGLPLLWWAGVTLREPSRAPRPDAAPVGSAAPVAVGAAPLLDSLTAQWQALTGPLPGRDRDVDAVRRALGMALVPLVHPALDLEAVWTTSAWGELIGALAYRHEGRLLVQYAVPDGVLRHSPSLLGAGDSVVAGTRADSLRLLVWRTPGGASVLMGATTLDRLRALRSSPSQAGQAGASRRPSARPR